MPGRDIYIVLLPKEVYTQFKQFKLLGVMDNKANFRMTNAPKATNIHIGRFQEFMKEK